MNHVDAAPRSGDRPDVRPSRDDRCAECGEVLGDQGWVCYRSDPADPQNLIKHFGGIVKTGPEEPPALVRAETVRSLRVPQDLGSFFYPACAPRADLSEAVRNSIAELLAKLLVAEYGRAEERWANVKAVATMDLDPPRYQAMAASIDGRRVFTMTRPEWDRLRAHEGRLVVIELERVPPGSVAESASVIARLAAECPIEAARIEVWRYNEQALPSPTNVQDYRVLEDLAGRLNVRMFAERTATQDSPSLRKHLRACVFIVKAEPDKARRQMKARAIERIVFKTVRAVETPRARRRPRAGR